MKILAAVKSHKMRIAVIVIVLEFVACMILMYTLKSGAAVTVDKGILHFIPKEQNQEIVRLQGLVDKTMEEYSTLSKTTVASDEYNRVAIENKKLVARIRNLKDAAAGKVVGVDTLVDPEQICMAIEQTFRKPVAMASLSGNAAEINMLVAAVSNEITQRGVIDTQQTEKYAFGIYLIQKVLDGVGYPIHETGGIKTTCDAVKKFQGDQKLKQDGKVGQGTWGKVREFWQSKKTPGQAVAVPSAPAVQPAVKPQPAAEPLTIKLPTTTTTQTPSSNTPKTIRRRVSQ